MMSYRQQHPAGSSLKAPEESERMSYSGTISILIPHHAFCSESAASLPHEERSRIYFCRKGGMRDANFIDSFYENLSASRLNTYIVRAKYSVHLYALLKNVTTEFD